MAFIEPMHRNKPNITYLHVYRFFMMHMRHKISQIKLDI